MSYDVLAARRQRQEAAGAKPWPFHLGEDHFEFPAEIPDEILPVLASLAELVDQGTEAEVSPELLVGLAELKSKLLSAEDATRLATHRLSLQDTTDLLMTYFEETFGGGLGESAESPSSSPPTPRTRKPTSKRTTASRSRTTTKAP